MAKKTLKEFEIEYLDFKPKLIRLETSIVGQINEIINPENISLGFPIQSRVKSFESITNKIENGRFTLKKSITELQDLVGIRIILLFNKDVTTICKTINDNFEIIKKYNSSEKLLDNQFGYSSEHFVVKIPTAWLSVPSFKDLDFCTIEIQVRTLSQHIWAEASNKFQYKQEESIPKEFKRTISRVSALLEIIDLEFDRLISERSEYKESLLSFHDKNELINVDIIEKVLDEKLPLANKLRNNENYAGLAKDLASLDIKTINDLIILIDEMIDYALKDDAERAKEILDDEDYLEDQARAQIGVFYTHIGLVRTMLDKKYGSKYITWHYDDLI